MIKHDCLNKFIKNLTVISRIEMEKIWKLQIWRLDTWNVFVKHIWQTHLTNRHLKHIWLIDTWNTWNHLSLSSIFTIVSSNRFIRIPQLDFVRSSFLSEWCKHMTTIVSDHFWLFHILAGRRGPSWLFWLRFKSHFISLSYSGWLTLT